MAPHDTNTPRQAKRHATPLIVMAVIVVGVLIGLIWWLGVVFEESPQTDGQPAPQAEQPVGDQAD